MLVQANTDLALHSSCKSLEIFLNQNVVPPYKLSQK